MKKYNKIISLLVLIAVIAATAFGAYIGIAGRDTKMVTVNENGVDVEYSYAFITHSKTNACVVIRVEDNAAALRVLKEHNFDLVSVIE